MPAEIIGEAAGGLFRAFFRIVSEIIMEVIVEWAIQGTGYEIAKRFKQNVDEDGWLATMVGLAFWAVVLGAAYLAYEYLV